MICSPTLQKNNGSTNELLKDSFTSNLSSLLFSCTCSFFVFWPFSWVYAYAFVSYGSGSGSPACWHNSDHDFYFNYSLPIFSSDDDSLAIDLLDTLFADRSEHSKLGMIDEFGYFSSCFGLVGVSIKLLKNKIVS